MLRSTSYLFRTHALRNTSHTTARWISTRPPSRHTTTATTTSQPTSASVGLDSLTRYPNLTTPGILRGLDYLGTISFAHSGAILAASSGMDVLGTAMVGTITAVGGGTIRDAIILNKRPFWTEETEYLYIALTAAGLTFALWPRERGDDSMTHFVSDSLGVGAFCVIGAQNGIRAGVSPIVCIICGMATATFGGVVRDVLCKKDVRILHSHAEVYATTAAGGAAAYLMARNVMGSGRVIVGVTSAVLARTWAWWFGTRLPTWQKDS